MTFNLSPAVSGATATFVSATSFQINGVFSASGTYTVTVTVNGQASSGSTLAVTAPATATLSGRVTETAPTTSTSVSGATVALLDGPSAGRTTTTDSNGNYSFTGVNTGNMNVKVSKATYDDKTTGVALVSSSQSLNFNLNPTAGTINETLTGSIDGGISTCSDGTFTKPCRIITINVHNSGTIDATMDWTSSSDLDLTLFRGTTVIASSRGVGSTEHVSASASAGSSYELRITYYSGSNIANYTVRLARPR